MPTQRCVVKLLQQPPRYTGTLPAACTDLAYPLQGYKAQSDLVLEHLDGLLAGALGRGESLIVEGVHLSLNAVMRLMARHAAIVPFLIHIRWALPSRPQLPITSVIGGSDPPLKSLRVDVTLRAPLCRMPCSSPGKLSCIGQECPANLE